MSGWSMWLMRMRWPMKSRRRRQLVEGGGGMGGSWRGRVAAAAITASRS